MKIFYDNQRFSLFLACVFLSFLFSFRASFAMDCTYQTPQEATQSLGAKITPIQWGKKEEHGNYYRLCGFMEEIERENSYLRFRLKTINLETDKIENTFDLHPCFQEIRNQKLKACFAINFPKPSSHSQKIIAVPFVQQANNILELCQFQSMPLYFLFPKRIDVVISSVDSNEPKQRYNIGETLRLRIHFPFVPKFLSHGNYYFLSDNEGHKAFEKCRLQLKTLTGAMKQETTVYAKAASTEVGDWYVFEYAISGTERCFVDIPSIKDYMKIPSFFCEEEEKLIPQQIDQNFSIPIAKICTN
jgi:hypothetical protein